jgi:hypothetical protein
MHALIVRQPTRGPEAVRFDPERSLWRDALALFQAAAPDSGFRRPQVCSQIAELIEGDLLDRKHMLRLELYGLASSQASIDLWRAESLPLPVALLTDAERLDTVRAAILDAESVDGALSHALWKLARLVLAPDDREPDKKDIGNLTKRLNARGHYWARLGQLFDRFLHETAQADDPDRTLASWRTAAVQTAGGALSDAIEQLGTQGRTLQAAALAERAMWLALAEKRAAPARRT